DESVVKDTVQGSHKEFPYTMGHTTISGCPGLWETHSELRELREVRASYNCIVRDVERYVESIEDNIIRSAMSLKYIEGAHTPTWDKVAYQIGGGNTADGLRMAVTRFLSRE
ncbi:MAG: hypothetical protein IJX77_07115, partial [Ruminococcus sp.]|nr:hypothetical protein [Ruminococcus sp.]